jgi:lipoate-protein ligase B
MESVNGQPSREELLVAHLGEMDYEKAVELQGRVRSARQAGAISDALLLLEHPPVYTKGRRTTEADLPMPVEWYEERGIDVVGTDRGGRVTYHGPGQLVGYPIMAVADVREYLRTMEGALIRALADEGIDAGVREGLTGVWVGERKIASIGVHVSRGVSTHGFAVNADNELAPFEWIVPCGIDAVRMTSVSAETGRADSLPCLRKTIAWRFAQAFGLRQRLVSLRRLLGDPLAVAAARPSASQAGEPLREGAS